MEPLAKLPPELAPLWKAVHSRLSSGRPGGRVRSRAGPLSIYQLITGSDGDDAVTTARFTGDGTALLPEDDDGQQPS